MLAGAKRMWRVNLIAPLRPCRPELEQRALPYISRCVSQSSIEDSRPPDAKRSLLMGDDTGSASIVIGSGSTSPASPRRKTEHATSSPLRPPRGAGSPPQRRGRSSAASHHPSSKQTVLQSHFEQNACPLCHKSKMGRHTVLCEMCGSSPQVAAAVLLRRRHNAERAHTRLMQHCYRCSGSTDPQGIAASCEAIACPVLSRRRQAARLLASATSDLADFAAEDARAAEARSRRTKGTEGTSLSSERGRAGSSDVVDLLQSQSQSQLEASSAGLQEQPANAAKPEGLQNQPGMQW